MKKRVAYIGISYPLLYDYRHQANKSLNDLSDSPNPIIESPLGLMIFYDEILFLCKSVCPNNMRNLPYVKFVDELYPNFDFHKISEYTKENENDILINSDLTYTDIKKELNIGNWNAVDTHTHGLRIGNTIISASSNEYCFLFDCYIFKELQKIYDMNIELIANSRYPLDSFNSGAKAELIDRIIIPGIPNYLSIDGPYHECIEELREDKYIKDFRKWIVENHIHIQRSEIEETCIAVKKSIEETKEKVFKKYLDENSRFSCFKSISNTILKTVAGIIYTPISIIDAFEGCVVDGKEVLKAESVRWQGFIMDSQNIMSEQNLI